MFERVFEGFRKASESSLQMQQDLFKNWSQQWFAAPSNAAGASTEWKQTFQKRSLELVIDMLNKHREALDSTYRSGIQMIEQTLRASEAKSPDDYRRTVEELGRRLFETFKDQSETQFREFQRWAEQSFDMAQKAQG
jgi:hypothetical protein